MITIREMQIDDLEQVMPIEEANFSIPWTETGFFTFLIRDDALFLVAEEDGEILGYLGILISFDESEITNVCVAEKARRRGIGRALMEELFRRMQERKVRVIHLDVRIGNTPARNLYESLGFVQDGMRKGYYDLPKEDAVLMSRTNRFRRGREKLLLYTHLTHRTFLSFPVGMAGKVCYNRQDTGESDFCFVSGTKKETFFDTREEEKCGNTTKTQMSWKRQCATAAEKT